MRSVPALSRNSHCEKIQQRHQPWLASLHLLDCPWLIFGSAPDPTLPSPLPEKLVRCDINNAGRKAQELGLGRADLTLRARKKSWSEHTEIDTRGLLWISDRHPAFLRLKLLTKPHRHIGSIQNLRAEDRQMIVETVSGMRLDDIGDLGKVTNGVAAICYALFFNIPQIIISGIALDRAGHSYDNLSRKRLQTEEDAAVLSALASRPELVTSEADLAAQTGIKQIF